MSAELLKISRGFDKALRDVKTRNAAARPADDAVFFADGDRGSMKKFLQLARHQTDDAARPANTVCGNELSERFLTNLRKGLLKNGFGEPLSFLVRCLELLGKRARLCLIFCREQSECGVRMLETSGSIEPRCYMESDRRGSHLLRRRSHNTKKFLQTTSSGYSEHAEPVFDDDAVLVREWHHVGNRSERGEIKQPFFPSRRKRRWETPGTVLHRAEECGRKLESDSA